MAVGIDAQAFALDSVQALVEQRQVWSLGQQCRAVGEKSAQLVDSFTRQSPQYGDGNAASQEAALLRPQARRADSASGWWHRPLEAGEVAWALAISLSP